MAVSLSILAVSALLCYPIWRLVRNYFISSAFENIPGPPSGSIFAGNFFQFLDHHDTRFRQDLIETYGPVAKIHGFFNTKWLHVYDPKALQNIYVKDQDTYHRPSQVISMLDLLLGPGLLATDGLHHKKQRKMLNPVFSAAYMRNLTPVFHDIAGKLHAAIETRVRDGPKNLDVLGWMGRTALELVGRGGLGHSFDPLTADSRDEYTEAVKEFIPAFSEVQFARVFFPWITYLGPAWLRRMVLDFIPVRSIQRVKRIVDIMHCGSMELFKMKKAVITKGDQDLLHAVGEGKDIMSILLKENMTASNEDKLPDEELLAQMGTLIMAGVDTTSNALSRVLYLLCEHPGVQQKLRNELLEAREQYGMQIPYDEVSQLPYLDAVCRETLRLHSPVNFGTREAGQDMILPLTDPIRGVDGTLIKEIAVPKGSMLVVNIRACNTNKALWGEDAYEWKPERWLRPIPGAVEHAHIPGIYSNLMTFGGGGRACIGFKFSQLEMKIVLSTLASSFKFEFSEKPVFWNFAGVSFPTTSKDSVRPEMYLKISLASQ